MNTSTPTVAASVPAKPGPKPKFHTLAEKIAGARKRKQAQRERLKDAGVVKGEFHLPSDVMASLALTANLTGTEPQLLAAYLVKGALIPYRRDMEALQIRVGELWLKSAPYRRYAIYLARPGAVYRVYDRVLTHAEWQPLAEEIATIRAGLTRRGWTIPRIDRFFRRAADVVQMRDKLKQAEAPTREVPGRTFSKNIPPSSGSSPHS